MQCFEAEREIVIRQIRNRLREVEELFYQQRTPIELIDYCVTGRGRGPERPPEDGWQPFAVHSRWGGFDQTTWFRMTVTIPESMRGMPVVALIRPGGESLVYLNGTPFQGIDSKRDAIFLSESAQGGEQFCVHLESVPSVQHDAYHEFEYAYIAVFDKNSWDVYWDFQVVLEVVSVLPKESVIRRRLLTLLEKTIKRIDLRHPGSAQYYESLTEAREELKHGLELFRNAGDMGNLVLVGQSHIDTAWLWPLRETRRKCGRTFSTVLRLMERYPDFLFMASQPAQLEWIKEHYPEVFQQIRERVAEGRWEPIGGMYVESDCNVPCGESFVRQLLFGNRFFRKEFGIHTRTAWLPDTFGDSWALPQILRKAQIDTFVTNKINWSEFTKFPYDYFQWEGPDGTRIACLIPPLNYDPPIRLPQLMMQWEQFAQKDRVDMLPFSYGYGDGGGGPTVDMIETGRRLGDIAGVPRCKFGRMQDCLDEMKRRCPTETLPVWNGELYLELHRGCQTTQARTKRNNRKCELLLRDAEFFNSVSTLYGGLYEQEAINAAWKKVLLNQFHDILPGSSITEVYKVAEEDYAAARALTEQALNRAAEHILSLIDTGGAEAPVVVFNTLPWVRTDVALLSGTAWGEDVRVVNCRGEECLTQESEAGELLFLAGEVPPLGYSVYEVVTRREPNSARSYPRIQPVRGRVGEDINGKQFAEIENEFLRICVDDSGTLTRIQDLKRDRDILEKGERGNVLQLFDDRPARNDAWDIDFNFADAWWEPSLAEKLELVENGPIRVVLRFKRKTECSTIEQDIVMYAHTTRVDFVTRVDWHEKRTLLKVAFPVDIRASRATYEIQFAAIERPTHNNTDWDKARFEVTGHKWADLSEGNYGVSLLNDCKYGYDIKGNCLRLSLLRSPISPDPHADEGQHHFVYSIYPHAGTWRTRTVQEAFELNVPLRTARTKAQSGPLPSAYSFASTSAENVIIHTVKRCEDSDHLIVRVYEAYGQRGPVELTFGTCLESAVECDLMEENDVPVEWSGHSIRFYIKPFEIRTFKVQLARNA